MSDHNTEFTPEEIDAIKHYFQQKPIGHLEYAFLANDVPQIEDITELYNLPEDLTLIKFADGTLTGRRKKEIQKLAQESLTSMTVVAAFVKEYSAVRQMSQAGFGWKGPYLSVTGKLPDGVSVEDWSEHLKRNPRARLREYIVRFFMGASLGITKTNLQGQWQLNLVRQYAVPSLLLLLVFSHSKITTVPGTDLEGAPLTIGAIRTGVPKGDPNTTPQAQVPATVDLTKMDEQKLGNSLDLYKNSTTPEGLVYYGRLCQEQARRIEDPDGKEHFQALANKSYQKAEDILKKLRH